MTSIYVLQVRNEETGNLIYENTFHTGEALEEEGISTAKYVIERYCEKVGIKIAKYAIERYCELEGCTNANAIITLNYKIGYVYNTIEIRFSLQSHNPTKNIKTHKKL